MIKIIGSYLKGDAIPSWLLDLESSEPNQDPCRLYFSTDCHLVETRAGYHLVFDGEAPESSMILAVGSGGHFRMVAPSRTVFTPCEINILAGVDDEIAAVQQP